MTYTHNYGRMLCMKKLLSASVLALIVAVSAVGFMTNHPTTPVVTVEAPAVETPPEPVNTPPEPIAVKNEARVIEAKKPIVEPVSEVVTNEQLIAQYHSDPTWNTPEHDQAMRVIINLYPEKFTEDKRKASFEYIHEVAYKTPDRILGVARFLLSIDGAAHGWVTVGQLTE